MSHTCGVHWFQYVGSLILCVFFVFQVSTEGPVDGNFDFKAREALNSGSAFNRLSMLSEPFAYRFFFSKEKSHRIRGEAWNKEA